MNVFNLKSHQLYVRSAVLFEFIILLDNPDILYVGFLLFFPHLVCMYPHLECMYPNSYICIPISNIYFYYKNKNVL